MRRILNTVTTALLVSACVSKTGDKDGADSDREVDTTFEESGTAANPDSEDSDNVDTATNVDIGDSDTWDTRSVSTDEADSATVQDIDYPTDYEPQDCEGEVAYLDPALELAVRKSVNSDAAGGQWGTPYDGELTGDLVEQIRTLWWASGEGIQFLGGIECVKGATRVELGNNRIEDIGLLAQLTQVTNLGLADNAIQSIDPLQNLSNIDRLTLSGNPVVDLEPISGLSNLTVLSVENMGLTSLTWTIGLANLSALVANGNAIFDLTPLTELPSLSAVVLDDNEVEDLSPLASLASDGLSGVSVSGNQISDLSALEGLSLMSLDVSRNRVSDISPLGAVIRGRLERLLLHENQIEDISIFAGSDTNIRELTLRDNIISDLSPLVGTWFSLNRESYDFSKNRISDLTPLASFGDFIQLDIGDNLVEDLSPLAEKSFRFLRAPRNRIRSLSSMLGVPLFDELDVTDNRISSVAPILAAARVRNWFPPDRIFLMGNPLGELALTEHLPVLCAGRNSEIYYGDGETCDWNTSPPIALPEYNPDPAPVDDVESAQPEECAISPRWLFEGDLPEVARNSGELLVNGAAPEELTVVDNVSGLEWRRCSVGQVYQNNTCQGIAPAVTVAEAASACADTYGGRDDWRIASVSELVSLVDFSVSYPGPVIDGAAFPGTYPGFYWGGLERPYRLVNFYNGTTDIAFNGSARARCVRGGGQAQLEGRFTASGAGAETVTDTWTGRQWRRCAEGQDWDGETCTGIGVRMPIDEANSACGGTYSGRSDWRLPTIRELMSILNPCGADPAAYSGAFPNTPQSSFWSGTTFPDVDPKTWSASFIYGWTEPLKHNAEVARVRCVRNAD